MIVYGNNGEDWALLRCQKCQHTYQADATSMNCDYIKGQLWPKCPKCGTLEEEWGDDHDQNKA